MTLYKAILADPPWTFKTYSHKGKGRSAEAHYDCMSFTDLQLMAPQIEEYAAANCALFLWVTDPMLPLGLSLMSSWGFTFKTVGFYWAKTTKDGDGFPIGTGYYTRANPEQCLLGTRGKPRRLSRSVRKLIVSPRREHSRKPDEVYDRIEALCEGPYLELFSRFPRDGWDSIGNQTGIETRKWKSNSYPPLEAFI
jgi:N6-adenosine-specific RNA methylase IME4